MQAFVAENAKDGWNGLEFAAARLTLADVLKAAKAAESTYIVHITTVY